jgi:two-component system, NarL family, nitrate/nitrite response regulator NarL
LITFAAIEDNRLLADALRVWVQTMPDMQLSAVVATVAELLADTAQHNDVVLLDPHLRAEPDPVINVRRLIAAGNRVLVVDGSADLSNVADSLAAGAHGYLTRDHDAASLAVAIRTIAAGGSAWMPGPGIAPGRPALSEREHMVLMAYTSGLTLESAARNLGISLETARTYLKRAKAKYQRAGLPVYTKLDLADQVRAEGNHLFRTTRGNQWPVRPARSGGVAHRDVRQRDKDLLPRPGRRALVDGPDQPQVRWRRTNHGVLAAELTGNAAAGQRAPPPDGPEGDEGQAGREGRTGQHDGN